MSISLSSLVPLLLLALGIVYLCYDSSGSTASSASTSASSSDRVAQKGDTREDATGIMSRLGGSSSKGREAQTVAEFRDITGAAPKDATAFVKKYKTLEAALDAFYNDPSAQSNSTGEKNREKKLGDIWERFKDPSDPKLIKIDGTMELCQELDIDPSSDSVLFCLATDLGSKVTGEWEKAPFVQGWMAMPGSIDSLAGMKSRLPTLRTQLNTDPAYFKKVYLHTFDLIKTPGSRVLQLDTALDMWTLFILPALQSQPSALAHESSTTPQFTEKHFEQWLDFQRKRGKAVSKDTWTLLVDFIRSIDADFKEYDESGAWPSTIDDFVEHVRSASA